MIHQEILKDKLLTQQTLERGLAQSCADDLVEAMINLAEGTCDYVDLIPVLEEIAHVEWFYYFDDNGAGGMPRPDHRRRSSFKAWALKAIENLNENAEFESASIIHAALKSNSTPLIKTTLQKLKSDGTCSDKSLIPILEKIARKDEYRSYSYFSGYTSECHLKELANEVIRLIDRQATGGSQHEVSSSDPDHFSAKCNVCGSLPDDITVNTGREEYFPKAYGKLIRMDSDFKGEFLRCPECNTYYNWIDMPQYYGSGNNDEERLVRLSVRQSQLLDKLFSADENFNPDPAEIDEFMKILPLDLLLPVLRFQSHGDQDIIYSFLPPLVEALWNRNDFTLYELLRAYITRHPQYALEVLEMIRKKKNQESVRINQLREYCEQVIRK